MYSLYRAWLSLGPCGNLPGLTPIPIASAPLNLSATAQFSGAPDVTLQVGPTLTEFSAHRSVLSNHSGFFKAALINHTGPTPIAVPNVNVDEFSSLLTFMYTGYLDLNLSNIYNILLATHILHMPRALEVCRSFLLHTQPIENGAKLIKPIPSRKSVLPHPQIYPPMFSNLKKSEATPFRAITTATNEKLEISQPSTSRSNDNVEAKKEERRLEKNKRKLEKSCDKVIVDVACCDGPVRFHRVLNKNYGMTNVENEYQIEKINRNEVMNKVMNENIRDKRLSDENVAQNSSNEVFTCLYCNHTFKSQYCYQKHARRHLNPVSLDNKAPAVVEQVQQKREVKLLDMNVQYYPCKTCGSKFPSYYFVHKHRKMCHAEEMADSGNKNNEIVAESNCNNDSSDSSKGSEVIDVETEESK
ncbi:hypothetical protein Trydic_g18359 [Trypoxylus dichotomus]